MTQVGESFVTKIDDLVVSELHEAMYSFRLVRLAVIGAAAKVRDQLERHRSDLANIADACLINAETAIASGDADAAYVHARLLGSCYSEPPVVATNKMHEDATRTPPFTVRTGPATRVGGRR